MNEGDLAGTETLSMTHYVVSRSLHYNRFENGLRLRYSEADENSLAKTYLMEALITRAEILAGHRESMATSAEQLLRILDRVSELTKSIEERVIEGRSPFAKKIRWALNLRESLLQKAKSDHG